ncbi:lipase [Xylariales sp. PMI_506]|nr:lipase [Xylariales sp. PMI_506]
MLSATWLLPFLASQTVRCLEAPSPARQQVPLSSGHDEYSVDSDVGISLPFFATLERLSRLVDIAYCVGTTGLSRPFDCASRCKDFPNLDLVTTWNTGILMSDSCGYIAVDNDARFDVVNEVMPKRSQKTAIIVAFRGTYSITNTIVDLSTVPQEYVPYPSPEDGGDEPPREPAHRCTNCTVHMGFLSSWKSAREDVLPSLKVLHSQHPEYPIHLVGHSLGGAVAALAALEMKVILGWDNVIVTTFGEPRVGNDGFARYLDEVFDLNNNQTDPERQLYRRLTHVDDPVPLLPLTEWGYRSHAGEIYISKPNLAPTPKDIRTCVGDYDLRCISGSEGEGADPTQGQLDNGNSDEETSLNKPWGFPTRLKLWQLFFAHRDYFWRLGLCVPGGDPIDWGRDRYPDIPKNDEL